MMLLLLLLLLVLLLRRKIPEGGGCEFFKLPRLLREASRNKIPLLEAFEVTARPFSCAFHIWVTICDGFFRSERICIRRMLPMLLERSILDNTRRGAIGELRGSLESAWLFSLALSTNTP